MPYEQNISHVESSLSLIQRIKNARLDPNICLLFTFFFGKIVGFIPKIGPFGWELMLHSFYIGKVEIFLQCFKYRSRSSSLFYRRIIATG